MYLFPSFNDLSVPGRLRQFVEDLNSGKLHREFHHGPDPSGQTTKPPESVFKVSSKLKLWVNLMNPFLELATGRFPLHSPQPVNLQVYRQLNFGYF
jgi:hypothetical protein